MFGLWDKDSMEPFIRITEVKGIMEGVGALG